MKWVEIITLRSPGNINGQFIDELLNGVGESDEVTDTPWDLVEIRIYLHSVVETDLSIHIHWESEKESQDKSPLGLRFAYALKPLVLLNYSVWVETDAREFVARPQKNSKPQHLLTTKEEDVNADGIDEI